MKALINYQKNQIAANRKEYGIYYDQLKKPSYYRLIEADKERSRLISEIEGKAGYLCNGTKPFAHTVSPGCRLCGEGHWSCLFVNNRCNCRCFYCPTSQVDTSTPETQGITFDKPENYIEYIKRFGFKGIGLSGGEPLLTFGTTLHFLSKIKKELGDSVYIWMYTNGTLLDEKKAIKLAAAGLDEIRFDLTATEYNTKNLKLALGKIPNVTVEIPAIPEDITQLKNMVIELDSLGVNFLNLHQMRLTPYNFKNLFNRNYTFLHGEKITVLESELTALKIINFVFQQELRLAVNYCSFHYKSHYQKSAFRKKAAAFVFNEQEEVNQNGFIRNLSLQGISMPLNALGNQLIQLSPEGNGWRISQDQKQIFLTKNSLLQIQLGEEPVFVDYKAATINEKPLEDGIEITISGLKHIFVVKDTGSGSIQIETKERESFCEMMEGRLPDNAMDTEELFDVSKKELPATGFAEYF
ncbi:MAG: radical SAM protein [Proteobacteria bacterium]|nr:radical SAM protein [Pseudomonadota bacterium]MBU1060214.1 radical SAM protein [Pseudomonadota bacterium]